MNQDVWSNIMTTLQEETINVEEELKKTREELLKGNLSVMRRQDYQEKLENLRKLKGQGIKYASYLEIM